MRFFACSIPVTRALCYFVIIVLRIDIGYSHYNYIFISKYYIYLEQNFEYDGFEKDFRLVLSL